jgi:hypothetical protein
MSNSDHTPGAPDSEPDPGPELPVNCGWSWTMDSLMMAEYVGYQLYLLLRDRFVTLGVPVTDHDQLIQLMIDTHDASAMTNAEARATCVIWSGDTNNWLVSVLDSEQFGPLHAD